MKQLPAEWSKYFWDVDWGQIDGVGKSAFVINRMLQWGRVEDLLFLEEIYGQDAIKLVIKKAPDLSMKQANFLALSYNLKREEVRCLQPEFRKTRKQLWKR
jgi:hypothetical protein